MIRIVFVLVAVAALVGVVARMAPASGQADGEAAPIFGVHATGETYCKTHHFLNENGRRMILVMGIRYEDTFVR